MTRPSDFTQEIADEICDRIAKGESLRSICSDEEAGWLPSARTVHRWANDNETFRQQYTRAMDERAEAKFEEAMEVANAATPETVAVARLKVDTIKWMAGKLAPKKYGDKIAHVGGGDGDEPIKISRIERVIVRPSD